MKIESSVAAYFTVVLPKGCYLSSGYSYDADGQKLHLSCTGDTPEDARRKYAESKMAIATAFGVGP